MIRRQDSGDGLSIYCYTEACTYDRAWDEYTRQARGLILDAEGNVVARPFPKFFNLGEPNCPPLPDMPYQVFEKLDGSLGIWFHDRGTWRCATKGSFDNEYTRWASAFADRFAMFPQDWTILTELVPPAEEDGMTRVVKHAPGVYLLGGTVTRTAEDIPLSTLIAYWSSDQLSRLQNVPISELIQRAEHLDGTEGWVVRFANGQRVKIKTAWYLRLFRGVSNLNERSIRELLLGGGSLAEFPEEFRAEAEAIRDAILDRVGARRETIEREFALKRHPDRKTFALSIQSFPDKSYLFDLYDGRDISERLLRTS